MVGQAVFHAAAQVEYLSNMRTIMPALQRAKTAALDANSLEYVSVSLPKQQRTTRVEKNMSADEIAAEIVAWFGKDS